MPSSSELSADELSLLIERVFQPTAADKGLAIVVDLPDAKRTDHAAWRVRREMAASWSRLLLSVRDRLALERVTHAWFPNVGENNADLPATCTPADSDAVLNHTDALAGQPTMSFDELLSTHSIIIAPTELSTTAPLNVAARQHAFRAATMPGFQPSMIPALKIDYVEVNRRVHALNKIVDEASSAQILFAVDEKRYHLTLDLRHRRGACV